MLQITDHEGRLLAFGNTRCLLPDVPVDLDAEYPSPDLGPTEPADPYLRPPPEDGYFSLDQVMNGTPIELQRRTIAGEKIIPICRLTGYRTTSVDEGRCKGVLPSSAWFSNGRSFGLRWTIGLGRGIHHGLCGVFHASCG